MSTPQWKKDSKMKARRDKLYKQAALLMEQAEAIERNIYSGSTEQLPELQRILAEQRRAEEKADSFALRVF